ncbi:unnamed protein product [marine sediment metagenome]|uniref:Uncharacterized protein n=1 Tax=marine sediment metagenome TaxID=412755 RepID=X1VL28_9ZZZZ
MSFTLGVKNAPSPATLWMALLAVGEGPNMTEPLPLSERWVSSEPAPGPNWMDIACFDPEELLVQESMVYVTIEDGKSYTFDFETETLQEVTVPEVPEMSWLAILGGLGVLGIGGLALALIMIPSEKV